jgi:thiol:disulfide interchange protein
VFHTARLAASVLGVLCLIASGRSQDESESQAQSSGDDARKAVAAAIAAARKDGRHILLNFGAQWCPECRILERTFADPAVARFLHANFVVVPVHIGRMVGQNYAEQNLDLVKKYGVFTTNANAGIPSIVILDSRGRVIARTDNGEWRDKGALTPEKVIQDLKRWAPKRLP